MGVLRSTRPAALLLLLAASFPAPAPADERAELERLLRAFLAGASVNDAAVHDRFWAEDLVYTSSAGERFGKDEIMAGLAAEGAARSGPSSATRYGAEDLRVRVLGEVAVLTFRLTAHVRGEPVGEYFNTGVFRRAQGAWQAFTWQATRIPPADGG